MEQISILIIEDEISESEKLTAILEENGYHITGIAKSYPEALKLFYDHPVDLIIIDVFLNGKPEGLTFAETLSITPNLMKPFVFLTASKDREIFERAKLTQPFSFLLKPFNSLEVIYAIEMAIEKFYGQQPTFSAEEKSTVVGADHLFIKKKKSLKKTPISEILYIEVEGRYCNIITAQERFVVLISLLKIADLLSRNGFIRTHRNYLVNSTKIKEINPEDGVVILDGEHHIALSENYKSIIENFHVLK
jgi:DNA-binding LytR/AlgR family response regulator